jgi:hypothetical protein
VRRGCVVVLDIGKTLSKLTIRSAERQLIERRTHRNVSPPGGAYRALDVTETNLWLKKTQAAFAQISDGVFALPSFQKGVGPFLNYAGYWSHKPPDQLGHRAVAGLYLALMTNVSLDLIGSKETLVVEGRFADDPVFTAALAALRPNQRTCLSDAANSLPYGALRLIDAKLPSPDVLVPAHPLGCDMGHYADMWRSQMRTVEAVA